MVSPILSTAGFLVTCSNDVRKKHSTSVLRLCDSVVSAAFELLVFHVCLKHWPMLSDLSRGFRCDAKTISLQINQH